MRVEFQGKKPAIKLGKKGTLTFYLLKESYWMNLSSHGSLGKVGGVDSKSLSHSMYVWICYFEN